MNITRTVRKDITALLRGQTTCVLMSRSQYFCETPKAFEIWDKLDGLDVRVVRIPKSSVLWVSTDESFLPSEQWIAERESLSRREPHE